MSAASAAGRASSANAPAMASRGFMDKAFLGRVRARSPVGYRQAYRGLARPFVATRFASVRRTLDVKAGRAGRGRTGPATRDAGTARRRRREQRDAAQDDEQAQVRLVVPCAHLGQRPGRQQPLDRPAASTTCSVRAAHGRGTANSPTRRIASAASGRSPACRKCAASSSKASAGTTSRAAPRAVKPCPTSGRIRAQAPFRSFRSAARRGAAG